MQKESFIFYKDWADAVRELPADIRLEIYDAIIEYGLSGKVPELKPMAAIAFNFIKKDIDRNSQKYYQKVEERSNSGLIGNLKRWHPDVYQDFYSKKITIEEALKIINDRKTSLSDLANRKNRLYGNDNVNGNDNDNDFFKKETNTEGAVSDDEILKILESDDTDNAPDDSKRKKVPPKKEKVTAFRPPTPEMVQQYCQERQNGIDANEFVDFYSSKGWMVGKNKMKDWQAAIRTWENSRKQNHGNNQKNTNGHSGHAGNSAGSKNGKTSARQFLAREFQQNASGNSQGGNHTIDVEVVE